ncbi:MAG: hypothetical protein EXS37_04690 [Opitutus sp.]|nr:hypothetical protein [Opitutus sp.]
MKAPSVNIRLLPLDLHLDLNWLDLDEFIPPGAKRVGPVNRFTAELLPPTVTRYPSTEMCTSPDGRVALFHDGSKQKGRKDMFHWLMLMKKGAPFPNTIFGTTAAFETSWSADSQRFAITHFPGGNSSEVFVVDLADLVRKPLSVSQLIETYFFPHLVSAPLFLKAYRWTRDGRLVIRAIARSPQEPHELFGCEAVVAFGGTESEPRVEYLRGFIKPQATSTQ